MKKILLLIIVIGFSFQLKAQQLTLKPADSLFFKTSKKTDAFNFKLDDSTLFKNFSPLAKLNQPAAVTNLGGNEEIFNSRMPVARVGNVENMPVAKLGDEPNNHYTMMIQKIKVIDPLATVKPVNP
jgi:hypothetical protein